MFFVDLLINPFLSQLPVLKYVQLCLILQLWCTCNYFPAKEIISLTLRGGCLLVQMLVLAVSCPSLYQQQAPSFSRFQQPASCCFLFFPWKIGTIIDPLAAQETSLTLF